MLVITFTFLLPYTVRIYEGKYSMESQAPVDTLYFSTRYLQNGSVNYLLFKKMFSIFC